jgi:hypothetical protein
MAATDVALAPRQLRLGGRSYPVALPSLRDARLHVAATLLTVQVLGQTVIDWDLSIAQILLSLGTCALLEVVFVFWERGIIAWPASALLTGNGVALLLRVPGTEHGDWWSMRGANIFVATAALSVLSKYVVRVGARPLFNPSNIGLVVCFLLLGAARAEPQDFWWGPWGGGIALTYAVILVGGVVIVRRLGLLPIAVSFWVAFAASLAVVAASGHAITARWHVGLVTDWEFWWVVVTSPETLIFLFFMITDPRTVPRGPAARIVFGAGVGVVAALLCAPQRTEYATKVAVLAALVVVCATRPLLERWLPAELALTERLRQPRVLGAGVATAAVLALALVGLGERSRDLIPPAQIAGDRPVIDTPAGPVPPVVIDDSVTEVTSSFDQETADAMAHDLVEDLAIEAEALRRGDEELLAQAAVGERLEVMLDRMGDPQVANYRFDELTLILHRQLAAGQATPRIGLEARGTVSVGGVTEDVATVFLLTEIEGHWLIDGERSVE